jgi:hypothetical protein
LNTRFLSSVASWETIRYRRQSFLSVDLAVLRVRVRIVDAGRHDERHGGVGYAAFPIVSMSGGIRTE